MAIKKTTDYSLQTTAEKASKKISKSNSGSPKAENRKQVSKDPQTMEELLAEEGLQTKPLSRGQAVEGTIVSAGLREVLIDIGAKSEGIVTGREFDSVRDLAESLSVGDRVTAQVVFPENDQGQIVLSLRQIGGEKRWKNLEEAKESGDSVKVLGMEVNRGGLIVDFGGIRGFLPSSQLDSKMIGKVNAMVGQTVEVYVLEEDRASNRLIFSQRKKTTKDDIAKIASKVKIGEKYEGTVTAVLPFGIFASFDELEGMVHISEIAWEKVLDPGQYFKVGDKINAIALGIDEASGRINLSVKQLLSDPWQKIAEKYSRDQQISGKITRLTPYGAFVNIDKGVDGLVHISKIPPDFSLNVGDPVDCTIESVDMPGRKISLSLVLKEKPVMYR